MRLRQQGQQRPGSIIPLIAISHVFLIGLVALAIDIGMLAVAKTQCQNAADAAATATVRSFTGNTANSANYNLANAPTQGITTAKANQILGTAVVCDPTNVPLATDSGGNTITDVYTSGNVTIKCGGYYYLYSDDTPAPAAEGFQIVVPGKKSTEPYTAVTATITGTSPNFFGTVFGANPFTVTASATAAYRPRDISIILDLSNSMRFQSSIGGYNANDGTGNVAVNFGPRNTPLNPDPNYPTFGHYSSASASSLLYCTSSTSYHSTDVVVTAGNLVYDTTNGTAIVKDYMSSGSTAAFTAADTGLATTPGGDNYLKASGNYVQTVNDLLGASPTAATQLTWCRNGYPTYSVGAAAFNGYTAGPNYWGKTFFIWPPDPRGSDLDATNTSNHANNGAKDWRQRFFFKQNTATGTLYWLDQNTVLFNPNGARCTTYAVTTPLINAANSAAGVTVTENGQSVTYRYLINYAAIFQWLRSSPTHFPSSMTSGRIQFYSSIPDPTGDSSFNNRFWTQSPMINVNERFWKEYVDFMLGQRATTTLGTNLYYTYNNNDGICPYTSYLGTGDMFAWGTTQVTQKPDSNYTAAISHVGGYGSGTTSIVINNVMTSAATPAAATLTNGTTYYARFGYGSTIYKFTAPAAVVGSYTITLDIGLNASVANLSMVKLYTSVPGYMNYADNPYRPLHQFWFGPQTWLDWLGNESISKFAWAGNTHESQSYACKQGIAAAIQNIQTNHPNDFVGLSFFSSPSYVKTGGGAFNSAAVPLGRSYSKLQNALYFPPSTVTGSASTITPYDTDFVNVPRASGSTAPQMGFMLTYNMFSSSTTNLRTFSTPSSTYRGLAGGLGRRGAQRLVIFETDGAPNLKAYAAPSGSGADTYYPIRQYNPTNTNDPSNLNEFPSVGIYSNTDVYSVVSQICAQITASTPGFSTPRKPVLVYCLGYGSLFDPTNSTLSGQANALTFLQTIQSYGNTSPDQTGANFPTSQRIYGSTAGTQIESAFTTILQNSVPVTLLK